MKNKSFKVLSMIIASTLACIVPGINQPTTINPSMLPTIVVLTANAAMTQTSVAVVPAGEFLTTGTAPALLNDEIPVTNREVLPDGTTKFTHVNGGYEVTFPAGWLTLRPNSDEFNLALAKEGAKNEMLRDQMNIDIASYEPGLDLLLSYPVRPDIEKNTLFGFSELEWTPNHSITLDEIAMGDIMRKLETGTIPGFRSDTAQLYDNGNKVRLIEVGGPVTWGDGQGGVIPFYVTMVFFKPSDNTLVHISFNYLKNYKLSISSDIYYVISTIKLVGQ